MAFLNEAGLEQVWGKIKTKVSSIENTISDINKAKVDKISGKGLSTNDFTTDEKNKLAGIATGATKVIVDSALNSTSTNAIQNKVVANMKTNIDDELSNKPSKTGDGASGTWGINVTGSATKLTTARSINGTSFDGTGNITTSCWGTARNIYITDSNNISANKSSAVSVNGNADITLKMPATFKMTQTQSITVAGDANTYYPVVISMSLAKDRPMEISIHKDLGSITPSSYEYNHSNGTSSLWLLYEGRNNHWDGNGGYIKTLYKYQGYATLVSHAEQGSGSNGDLRVWLRGGGCYYEISTTINAIVNIYYSKTNLGTSSYPDEVTPRTTIGNGGIVTNALLGYGNIQGNATTATTCTGNASTATKLATARTISLTGSVTGSGSFNGSGNLSITTTTNHTHNYAGSSSAGGIATNSYSLANKGTLDTQEKIDNFLAANVVQYATFKTSEANNVGMGSNDGMILSIAWTGTAYGAQIAFDDSISGLVKIRGKSNSWGSWHTLLHSGNYTDYTVKKDGTGASGNWGINITGSSASCTGNAATATKATQDGSGNVISSTYLKLSGGAINGSFRVRHSTNHPYLSLESTSYNAYQSEIYYSIPSSSATANFGFREYSRSSSDHTLLSYYEEFELPSVTSDRTSNSTYRILTSKFTVSVAQGGTGAATKSGARSNLGITSGTSLPSASGYSAGDIFILY